MQLDCKVSFTVHFVFHLAIGVFTSATATSPICKEDICVTKGCNDTATRIRNNINWTANPCEDFHEYACGGFINRTHLEASDKAINQFLLMARKIDKDLLSILNESVTPNDTLPTRLVKTYFKSCINKTQINLIGTQALVMLIDYIGGWPVLTPTWNKNIFNWENTTLRCHERGLNSAGLLSFDIESDEKNSSANIIYIKSPKWSTRESVLKGLSDVNNKARLELMINVSVILGANRTVAEKEMAEAFQFMIELANNSISSEDVKNRSLIYNKRTIKDLISQFPNIPWLHFVNGMLLHEYNITENEHIIITDLKYLEYFNKNIFSISNRTMANYLVWSAIFSALKYMNDDILMAKLDYEKIVDGIKGMTPRDVFCIEQVKNDDTLKLGTGVLYAEKFYVNGTKEAVSKFIIDIKVVLNETLTNITWMDNATRAAAKAKLAKLKSIIAYPDQLLNETITNAELKGLTFEENQFLFNALNVSIFRRIQGIKDLQLPSITLWKHFTGSATINAYYVAWANLIYFPLGILQGISFGVDYPKYINYGLSGFIAGHEVTHAFDDQGSQYDGDGNVQNWWDASTRGNFKNLSECFVRQYSVYVPEFNITIDGKLTLSENIADNGGMKQSYLAYQRVKALRPDKQLVGLQNFTSNQLFWLSFANAFCVVSRPEFRKNYMQTNTHAEFKYRTNFIAKNNLQFREDWKCPSGSAMAPGHICSVW